MLADLAARIAADLAPGGVAALAPTARGDGDEARWSTLVEAGLVALHIPAERGGADEGGADGGCADGGGADEGGGDGGGAGGGGVVAAALVAERLAGDLVPVPFVGAAVWAPTLLAAAGDRAAVQAVAAGTLRLAPVLRTDLTGLAGPGEPGVAFDAQGADAGLRLGAGGCLRAVRLGESAGGADLTRSMCPVPADAPAASGIPPVGGALTRDDLARAEAVVLAVLAADLLGVMGRALDDAVAHVRGRAQFGVPVGSFQAVQHLAAHGAVLVEGARSSMWHAAWAAGELPTADALLAARQAKAFCASAAREVGEIAIQMLGGIGLTWEHLAQVRQRRILLSRRVLGDENAQYAAIAATRLAGVGAGTGSESAAEPGTEPGTEPGNESRAGAGAGAG
ncbi:hypothetical protein CcI49_25600 [Frankia sp. CcI49]|nr:hypothetical protein CcI49_25600 [Frankia sp. CcI49]